MVIIKTTDKSTFKTKINYQSNCQSDINTDLSNISNPCYFVTHFFFHLLIIFPMRSPASGKNAAAIGKKSFFFLPFHSLILIVYFENMVS